MTTTKTETGPAREVSRRAGQLMAASDVISWDEALSLAADQLQAEQAARAASEARTDALVAGFEQMTACVCGASALGSRDGFCASCSAVAAAIRAERAGADLVDGRTRRELVEAVLDRRAAS